MVDLAFALRFSRGVVMDLGFGSQLKAGRGSKPESVVLAAAVQPRSRQVEWRLRARFRDICRRQGTERSGCLKLRRQIRCREQQAGRNKSSETDSTDPCTAHDSSQI